MTHSHLFNISTHILLKLQELFKNKNYSLNIVLIVQRLFLLQYNHHSKKYITSIF